jgi:SAM-dependent methyltransferase
MAAEYGDEFYLALREGARKSAEVIVPMILQDVQPRSIVDVGCGTGTWLSVFREHGVTDILGVDGRHVNKEMLEIPERCFLTFDLRAPFRLGRQFDLVVSLEVAEHLPADCSRMFVDTLVGLGPLILFSAAIPLQGGTHHVNEQWPDYWVAHFERTGYVPVDLIRKRVWRNLDVDFWYIQNSLIFARRELLGRYPVLRQEFENAAGAPLSLVHPRLHTEMGRRLAAASDEHASSLAAVEKHRAEAEAHHARAEAEVQRARAEAEAYRLAAEPRNMGLKKILHALPRVAMDALRRRGRRYFLRG